jgi:hypothetical protein
MASPYFDSANQQIDESKKGLLEAVAQAGTQGKQAYDAAQAQAAQARQDAMSRAAERSALYGVGGDNQTFLGGYDARANQMGVNRSNFESGLAQTAASGQSYLEKARASVPMLEAQNIGKVTDQETKIKLAIQAAKDKAQAELDKETRAEQRAREREDRADTRANTREDRADQRARDREAAKPMKDPSADLLLAAGRLGNQNPLNKARLDANSNILNSVTMNPDVNMAHLAGQDLGYSPLQVQTALSPKKVSAYQKSIEPPPTPDAKWLTSNVRGYDTKKAQQVLADPDFQAAHETANQFASTPVDADGFITETGPYEGLTPNQAFEKWLRPLNHTWTDAALKYYGGFLSSAVAK